MSGACETRKLIRFRLAGAALTNLKNFGNANFSHAGLSVPGANGKNRFGSGCEEWIHFVNGERDGIPAMINVDSPRTRWRANNSSRANVPVFSRAVCRRRVNIDEGESFVSDPLSGEGLIAIFAWETGELK